MANCYHLLGKESHWQINKQLARLVGIEAALFLSDLISKREYFSERGELEDGWFFNTQENIEKDTTLSEFQQRKAISILVEKGFITIKKMGIPAKNHFIINDDLLLNYLTTSGLKIRRQGVKKVDDINKNKEKKIKKDISDKDLSGIFNLHSACIDFWCKELKPDYVFSSKDAKHIKDLYGKIKTSVLRKKNVDNISDEEAFEAFKLFCSNIKNIDQFYQTLELSGINSNYNSIYEKIKLHHNQNNKNNQVNHMYERELTENDFPSRSLYESYLKTKNRKK